MLVTQPPITQANIVQVLDIRPGMQARKNLRVSRPEPLTLEDIFEVSPNQEEQWEIRWQNHVFQVDSPFWPIETELEQEIEMRSKR